MRVFAILAGAVVLGASSACVVAAPPPDLAPSELAGLAYEADFFPGAVHDPAIPTPASLLGFELGERVSTPAQITACLEAWAAASPRAVLVEYARSHEGRPLHYLIVTSPENQARLDDIRAAIARLADPEGLDEAEAGRLLAATPAVAWLAYSIHGNEASGADAALAVAWHLVAGTDPEVEDLLAGCVVMIDPLMNPDGRHRFCEQIAGEKGRNPSVDDQSLHHRGGWPSGRGNHYLFDLNRDWAFGVHPETRGRLREIGAWHPLLLVDGHEMGSQDTYLFSPPRDPINPGYPERMERWGRVFARDQAAAFDARAWPYYTGEWLDEWYPGYSTWNALRGGVFILYEQARVAPDAVRRPGGELLPYRRSVHHQVVSSLANLRTFAAHREELAREFLAERRQAISARGPYAGRTFAVLPTANAGRLASFREVLDLHGIRHGVLAEAVTVRDAVDQLGVVHDRLELPAGTVVVPNRQPEGRLAAALLEFDPRFADETLGRERQELLRKGRSRMYDVTAWNLTMMDGLEAVTVPAELRGEAPRSAAAPEPAVPADAIALAFDGADDRSPTAAARLLERGVAVHLADEAFSFAGVPFARGTVLVLRDANRGLAGDWTAAALAVGRELDWPAAAIRSGLGEDELPDIGGRHFRRLEAPALAILTRGGVSSGDYGAIWHAVDTRLGIRHAHLDETSVNWTDLRRYNVVVLPDRWGAPLPEAGLAALRDWVEDGGTLIAVGDAARQVAAADPPLSGAALLPAALDEIDLYERAVLREWLARDEARPDLSRVWSHAVPAEVDLPVPFEPDGKPEVLKKRDAWLSIFMPQGALLAGRIDAEHWLTVGCGGRLPLLYGESVGSTPVLMAAERVEAPVRFGVFRAASAEGRRAAGKEDEERQAGTARVGWSPVPDGQEVALRMSGLLWPEAAQRLASSAYLTRERRGRGQVILFATPPAFRGATLGTMRLLLNAVVYGPGLGASRPIAP